jgi:hypothetical protein
MNPPDFCRAEEAGDPAPGRTSHNVRTEIPHIVVVQAACPKCVAANAVKPGESRGGNTLRNQGGRVRRPDHAAFAKQYTRIDLNRSLVQLTLERKNKQWLS